MTDREPRAFCLKCAKHMPVFIREEPEFFDDIKKSVMQTKLVCRKCLGETYSLPNVRLNAEKKTKAIKKDLNALYIGTDEGTKKIWDKEANPDIKPEDVVSMVYDLNFN